MDIERPHSTASKTTTAASVGPDHTQRRTAIVDLPTELIFLIVQDLGHADLLSLAKLCRRLHHIALTLYFKHNGVQDIRGNLKVTFINDYLPGLRMALFLTSAREIEFTFRNSPHLPQDMREAAHLISRFTQIDYVRLNFQNLTFQQSSTGQWVTDSLQDMTTLNPVIRSLLDATRAKSCKTFGVCYGHIKTNPHESFDLTQEMETACNAVTSPICEGQKGSDWPSPEFPGPPLSSLQSFHFKSNILLCKPLLNWTFRTLEGSSRSLVKLYFRHLSLKTSDWAYLLPRISLPSLATLVLATKTLDFSDLVLFLRRHPHLRDLCICGGKLRIGDKKPELLPAGLFPALRRLCGSTSFISHLLQNSEQFPRLVDVDIRPDNPWSRAPDRLAIQNHALALVAKLVPASKEMRITIPLFREILYPHSKTPVLEVSEGKPPRSLLNVSRLKLRADTGFMRRCDHPLVARWLALFPALLDVTFSQDFFPSTYDETSKCAFVEQIVVECPQIEYVAIGKDDRSVVTWRRSSASGF